MDKAKLTLEEIKQHLRVDHDLDDELLKTYLNVAVEVAQKHIGKTFGDEASATTIPFNQSIKVGCLMYIAHLYSNREMITDSALSIVPMTIKALWEVYREPCVY